eukprot:748319-Hanusia_phi.AAC.13
MALGNEGLPFKVQDEDIRAFFKSESFNPAPQFHIVKIMIELGSDGRPTGDALVEFGSEVSSNHSFKPAVTCAKPLSGISRYVELRRSSRPSLEDDRGDGRRRSRSRSRNSDRDRRRDRDRDRDRDRGRKSRSRSRGKDRWKQVCMCARACNILQGNDHLVQRGGRRKRGISIQILLSGTATDFTNSNWDKPPEFGPDGTALIAQSANPQLTLKARRVYVGNLPQLDPPISEPALKEFFDQAMHQVQIKQSRHAFADFLLRPVLLKVLDVVFAMFGSALRNISLSSRSAQLQTMQDDTSSGSYCARGDKRYDP